MVEVQLSKLTHRSFSSDIVMFLPLLFLLLTGEGSVTGMEMVSSSPIPGTITKEGSPLSLACSSSSPWFFCLWHSPSGGKQCAIQENEVNSVCEQAGEERTLHADSTSSCSLHIRRLRREDHGKWMCLLNDITEFDTVRRAG